VNFALNIKKSTKLPVIYSGNVNEENYKDFLKDFDYVMIGRAAIGHPEIFAEITGKKRFKRSYKSYLKLARKYDLPFRQMKFQAMQFTKGLRDSKEMRRDIFKYKDQKDLEN